MPCFDNQDILSSLPVACLATHQPPPGRLQSPLQPYFRVPVATVAHQVAWRCCRKHGECRTLPRWLWRRPGVGFSLSYPELQIITSRS